MYQPVSGTLKALLLSCDLLINFFIQTRTELPGDTRGENAATARVYDFAVSSHNEHKSLCHGLLRTNIRTNGNSYLRIIIRNPMRVFYYCSE